MKFPLLKNSFRPAELVAQTLSKKCLFFVLAIIFITVSVASSVPAFASGGPPPAPPTQVPSNSDGTQNNALVLVGEHCHDLDDIEHYIGHTVGYDDSNPPKNAATCGGDAPSWEDDLHSNLGCSDSMFYTHKFYTDPNDNSVYTQKWYTKEAAYKDCYNRAQAQYALLAGTDCKQMKKGSDNWDKCENEQNQMHDALGCSNLMFQDLHNGYWGPKPAMLSNCKDQVDLAGNQHIVIINSAGKPVADQNPVSSTTVKSTDPTTDPSGNSEDDDSLGCDISTSPLSWIICPVVDLMVGAINITDNIITDQLTLDSGNIFCTSNDTCHAYYAAWSSFRNIALGLMVIAGLIVVIAQAVGMEILDAYMIRKTLPRILIAAVAITLSWPLMSFLVNLSNDLGFGVRHLIVAPFSSFSDTIQLDFAHNSALNSIVGGAVGGGVAVVAVPLWIVTGGIGILMSYVATAGLAVLIAVLVLILRQIVIGMLIILAPIAIVAYIMPNTQRIYKLWWEAFSRALLMFPMIAALIAIGRVFSAISLSANSGSAPTPVTGIIGFAAYFAPYFMIPLTFKFAGGALSGIGNAVNQRAQGGYSALAGYRSNKRKDRIDKQRNRGGLWSGGKGRPVRNALNTIGAYTVGADEQLTYDLGTGRGIGRGKYNPIGRIGQKALGARGTELGEKIAAAKRANIAKSVEAAPMHYSGAYAAAGLYQNNRAGAGLSTDGKEALVTHLNKGVRNDSEKAYIDKSGEIQNARALKDANIDDVLAVSNILSEHGEAGSHAQQAGQELRAHAGTLSRLQQGSETGRSSIQATAMAIAAKDGKLSGDEIVKYHNAQIDAADADPYQISSIKQETDQLLAAGQQHRQDLRPGKGIRNNEDGSGRIHYVHSELNQDGKAAYDSVMSAKGASLSSAKAETVDGMAGSIIGIYKGQNEKQKGKSVEELARDKQAIKQQVMFGLSNSYGDPGALVAWQKIAKELPDFNPTQAELDAAAHQVEHDEHGNPHPPGGGGDGGIAPPPNISPGGVILPPSFKP